MQLRRCYHCDLGLLRVEGSRTQSEVGDRFVAADSVSTSAHSGLQPIAMSLPGGL
uniref:Uncharacterized protein n=1 Tax=Agrobacterium tumefaciens TaxID=358 RepID=K7WUI5_AGRTU|nr:Hypothetical protein [Agrobacterium radiobacter]